MATTYLVVNGMVLQEDRDGVVREYRPDTNGNTIALTDATSVTDSWEYWPFGEVRSRTGSNPTPFQFGGILGYYTDSSSRLYVRARHYRQALGRWQTVDPLWPIESAYGYVNGQLQCGVDPSGRMTLAATLVVAGAVIPPVAGVVLGCVLAVIFVAGVQVLVEICQDVCFTPVPTIIPSPAPTTWPLPTVGDRAKPLETVDERGKPVPLPHEQNCKNVFEECYNGYRGRAQGIECYDCYKMCMTNGFWDFSQRKCNFY